MLNDRDNILNALREKPLEVDHETSQCREGGACKLGAHSLVP